MYYYKLLLPIPRDGFLPEYGFKQIVPIERSYLTGNPSLDREIVRASVDLLFPSLHVCMVTDASLLLGRLNVFTTTFMKLISLITE